MRLETKDWLFIVFIVAVGILFTFMILNDFFIIDTFRDRLLDAEDKIAELETENEILLGICLDLSNQVEFHKEILAIIEAEGYTSDSFRWSWVFSETIQKLHERNLIRKGNLHAEKKTRR